MADTKNMHDGSDVDNIFPEKTMALHSEKVVGETAAENHYYQQFAAATPEWRAAFEKKLMRKVDLRLVPLLIVSASFHHRLRPATFKRRCRPPFAWRRSILARSLVYMQLTSLQIMYLNNFIDRAALGQARLSTLEEDLGMTGTDFNLSISILFVGYLTMQLPSNLLITRVRPCEYSPVLHSMRSIHMRSPMRTNPQTFLPKADSLVPQLCIWV